jgi:uncharacterized protein (UPF0335 family)
MSKPNFAKDQLKSIVERIERLEEEKAALGADIREVYSEAKGHGFDTKIIRKVVALRKIDAVQAEEQAALLDLYLSAVNGWPANETSGTATPAHQAQAAE